MQQTLVQEGPSQKVYNDRAIWLGTFIGGPLVAGYFIAENFKAFNRTEKVRATWIYAILATVVIFGGMFLIPEHILDRIPSITIPMIYTAIVYYLVQHFQGESISAHVYAGGSLFHWGRVVGIGFIGLVVSLVLIFGFIFLTFSVEN